MKNGEPLRTSSPPNRCVWIRPHFWCHHTNAQSFVSFRTVSNCDVSSHYSCTPNHFLMHCTHKCGNEENKNTIIFPIQCLMFAHPITSQNSAFIWLGIQQSNKVLFFLFVRQNVPLCGAFRCEQPAAVVYAHILDIRGWIANMYDCNDVITHGPITKEIHSKICLTTTIERLLGLYGIRQFGAVIAPAFIVFILKHVRTHTEASVCIACEQRDAGYHSTRPNKQRIELRGGKTAARPQKHFMNEISIARFWRSERANITQCQILGYDVRFIGCVRVCLWKWIYQRSFLSIIIINNMEHERIHIHATTRK